VSAAPRTVACRSCQAPIVFFRTAAGLNIPIDARTVRPTDTEHDPKRHVAHFATCPNAAAHRRRRRRRA
jgi:hypothetical protein